MVDLLAKEYPWFLETWRGYRHHIQRADSIRYFILAQYGGIYIDLDNVSLQSSESVTSLTGALLTVCRAADEALTLCCGFRRGCRRPASGWV